MCALIPYGRQSIAEEDIQAVREVLKSDFLTCGPKVDEFELSMASYCGAEHAVAVSNGTAALHLAMLAAGIGVGDRVITSPNTFLASANCGEFVGATVDFADIDPDTLCLSVDTLRASWKDDVKAVVAVDFAGYPCASKEMVDFVHERGAILIEDGCHAIGGGRDRYKVGGLPWVDMTTFSFHPVKTMTTGEGGAVVTNKAGMAECCRLVRNHGMVKNRPEEPWYYEMEQLGCNYRITDLQCTLGISQLKKLDGFVRRRQDIVDQYNTAFGDLDYVKLPVSDGLLAFNRAQGIKNQEQIYPAWHLYVVQIDFPGIDKSRTRVMKELLEGGVGTQVHYIPVHLQPYYRDKYGYAPGKCPHAEGFYERCLSLPLFPAMTDDEVTQVIDAVLEVVA